jgi:tRNA 2-selenouridine synthase
MPVKQVEIESLFHSDSDRVIIDVRSPGEYSKAHIPSAYNLPLFSDEERAIVGTAYKQESPERAMLLGLEFAGKNMRYFIEQALLIAPDKKVFVHCWRGGKRSESMAWLLSMAGFDVEVIIGGYKSYRKYALNYFYTHEPKLVVLGGQTGIGKTYVLHQLELQGEQIIDLEKLANHKGSAFGSLGQEPQPSTEHFENLLFDAYRTKDKTKRIFVENESQIIGTCLVQAEFFKQMKQYYYIQYTIPLTERIEHLIQNYACYPKELLKERFLKIKNKLGGDNLQKAMHALDIDDYGAAAMIALHFYDKTYQFGFEKNTTPHKIMLDFDYSDSILIAQEIIKICNNSSI